MAQTIQLNRQIYMVVCWNQLILAQGNCGGKHLFSNLHSIMSSFWLEIASVKVFTTDIVNAANH